MNMKKTFLATICLFAGINMYAQQTIDVQPVPQKVTPATQTIKLTGTYQLNGINEANPYASEALKTILSTDKSVKGGMKIYIGERGDKAISKYKKFIPAQAEGYFLRISPKEIVLAGYDECGTYYAVQTLTQKLAGQCGKLKCCLNYETAAYMDAQSRIPKVHNPLEFEDGLAYLMKTDILREIMYFSYDPQSLANLYPLYAEDVWDIIHMNRNGEKPASLKSDDAPAAPEFVTAVGDDSISRFDEARKRKKKKKSRGSNGGGQKKAAEPAAVQEAAVAQKPQQSEQKREHKGGKGHRNGNRNRRGSGGNNQKPAAE